MKNPPIDWEDLIAIGVDQNASIFVAPSGCSVDPPPPGHVRKLLAALHANPVTEEDRMSYLRHIRDLLMDCTDYTQAADSPLAEEDRAAWAAYRQSLRDLPATYRGNGQIPWPVAPA